MTSRTPLKLDNIHLVGHDLGAHAASYTGHRIYGIGRITGKQHTTGNFSLNFQPSVDFVRVTYFKNLSGKGQAPWRFQYVSFTGLDPSTIYFEGGDVNTALDPDDALFVEIVHTDAPYNKHIGLGFRANIGNSTNTFE